MERKVCFISDAGNWRGSVKRVDICPKADSLSADDQWSRALIDRGRALHAETLQSALTVILKLVIGGLTSIILTVWGTVNFHFQGCFFSISLRPFLGIMAAYIVGTVWSLYSWFLPLCGGFSIYRTAHRIWLRILSIALEEARKVLDYAYWLHFNYLVSFDCFSLFLHFLSSLIKHIYWWKFSHRQKAGQEHGEWAKTRGSCSIPVLRDILMPKFIHCLTEIQSLLIVPLFGGFSPSLGAQMFSECWGRKGAISTNQILLTGFRAPSNLHQKIFKSCLFFNLNFLYLATELFPNVIGCVTHSFR